MSNGFSVTGNKEFDFYLQNYDDIEAFKKIVEVSEIGIPQWVAGEIKDIIRKLHRNDFFEELNLEYHEDGIWWSDRKYYDEERGVGVFFQFEEGLQLKHMTNPKEPVSLRFAMETEGKTKKVMTTGWQRYITKCKKELNKKNILVYENDEENLAKYSLWDFTNINVLKKQSFSAKPIEKAVKDFTLSLLPLIRKRKP